MLYHKYKPLAARVYCAGLALLLVLSEVFSSNVQDTLPGFSRPRGVEDAAPYKHCCSNQNTSLKKSQNIP